MVMSPPPRGGGDVVRRGRVDGSGVGDVAAVGAGGHVVLGGSRRDDDRDVAAVGAHRDVARHHGEDDLDVAAAAARRPGGRRPRRWPGCLRRRCPGSGGRPPRGRRSGRRRRSSSSRRRWCRWPDVPAVGVQGQVARQVVGGQVAAAGRDRRGGPRGHADRDVQAAVADREVAVGTRRTALPALVRSVKLGRMRL